MSIVCCGCGKRSEITRNPNAMVTVPAGWQASLVDDAWVYACGACLVAKKVACSSCPEIVICAAVRLEDGRIFRGHRHTDALRTSCDVVGDTWKCPYGDDQGFITSRNRYVTREEALQLQHAAGIPSACPSGYRARQLFSEDLY